jgi:hypothetical protein
MSVTGCRWSGGSVACDEIALAARLSNVPPTRAATSSPTSNAVHEDDLVPFDEPAEVNGRPRLADDLARHLVAQVFVNLGLNGVDDLQPLARIERVEIALEPVTDHRVTRPLQDILTEPSSLENGRHFQDGVLGVASETRVLSAQVLVGFEKRQHREAECVLHARAPEAIELATEDAQRVGGSLIPIPAHAGVQQVDAEGPAPVGDVEVDHIGLAVSGNESQRG